ncbi:hypothetical protein [Isoptericola aurantiacus]|uniref:hypothetical protein n=1 Tax=Isoptericola aurantiacus TaxID=3377839 RepID=UPI00383A9BBB
MPVRAVVLPAAPLLVTGAAGDARPLAATRAAVHRALRASHDAGARRWGVLAPATGASARARRPSLAAAGIADRWVPALAGLHARDAALADLPASVALLVLVEAVGPGVADSAPVVELADDDGAAAQRAVADLGTCDVLVVAGGVPGDAAVGPTALTRAVHDVLDRLAGLGGWRSEVRTVAEDGPHLAGGYDVVTWTS